MTAISCMLAVEDTPAAVAWYLQALDARVLWSLGSVAALEIGGAPFFLHEPVKDRLASPRSIGTTTVRVELFVDDPETVMVSALKAGATAGSAIRDHEVPWGIHRQGSFTDPFGHVWNIGDKSPLAPANAASEHRNSP